MQVEATTENLIGITDPIPVPRCQRQTMGSDAKDLMQWANVDTGGKIQFSVYYTSEDEHLAALREQEQRMKRLRDAREAEKKRERAARARQRKSSIFEMMGLSPATKGANKSSDGGDSGRGAAEGDDDEDDEDAKEDEGEEEGDGEGEGEGENAGIIIAIGKGEQDANGTSDEQATDEEDNGVNEVGRFADLTSHLFVSRSC